MKINKFDRQGILFVHVKERFNYLMFISWRNFFYSFKFSSVRLTKI